MSKYVPVCRCLKELRTILRLGVVLGGEVKEHRTTVSSFFVFLFRHSFHFDRISKQHLPKTHHLGIQLSETIGQLVNQQNDKNGKQVYCVFFDCFLCICCLRALPSWCWTSGSISHSGNSRSGRSRHHLALLIWLFWLIDLTRDDSTKLKCSV